MMLPDHRHPLMLERAVDGVVILSVEEVLKGEGEAALRERLDGLVQQGHLHIVIDLRDVPRMDSTELGRIIRSHISLRRAGGRVRLCNVSDRVMTLMKLTRLDTVLDIYSTAEEAIAAFRRSDSEPAQSTVSSDKRQ